MSPSPDDRDPKDTRDPDAEQSIRGALDDVLAALETQPEELDETSERLFGEVPEASLEDAAIEHARRAGADGSAVHLAARTGTGGAAGARLEEFVRLTFLEARGHATTEDQERLAALGNELRGKEAIDPDAGLEPEVDSREFIRRWRRENPHVEDPLVSESGEVGIDPMSVTEDDDPQGTP